VNRKPGRANSPFSRLHICKARGDAICIAVPFQCARPRFGRYFAISGNLIGCSHCIGPPNQEDVIKRMFMELVSDHDRRISIEDLDTSQLLAHAARQTRLRKFDDLVIVDIDYRHYEKLAFQQHAGTAESEPDQARQSRGVA
jgi:hypothetical protein